MWHFWFVRPERDIPEGLPSPLCLSAHLGLNARRQQLVGARGDRQQRIRLERRPQLPAAAARCAIRIPVSSNCEKEEIYLATRLALAEVMAKERGPAAIRRRRSPDGDRSEPAASIRWDS